MKRVRYLAARLFAHTACFLLRIPIEQVDRIERVGETEDGDYDDLPPYPPVALNEEAHKMIRDGLNATKLQPPPSAKEERPLRGSLRDRVEHVRRGE
jgi:hypothetical protein